MCSEDACDAFVEELSSIAFDWGLACILESDGFLNNDHILNFGQHVSRRHWPGPGSSPMCVIVHRALAHCIVF